MRNKNILIFLIVFLFSIVPAIAAPPELTINSPEPIVYTNSMRIPLNITTTGDTCWYSLDGGSDVSFNCTEVVYLDIYFDGEHTLSVTAYNSTTTLDTTKTVKFIIQTDLSAGKGFVIAAMFLGFILISMFLVNKSSLQFGDNVTLKTLCWFVGCLFIILSLAMARVISETFIRIQELTDLLNTGHSIIVWIFVFIFIFTVIYFIYQIILSKKQEKEYDENRFF